ncbi:DUF983 domain-containing protein [Kaustia mangrovi]|uniref:DUF983 domain-containing protein n=2 Tax=Kaustia mangrovi TaxID=2593653 RepID=A0A7S8C8C8_9HYPH|nr:DUF983 domain-containing protein [Kaustia mangrovi]
MMRGARLRCPACGEGSVFARYLKVAPVCGECGEELHHHRADDAPPYFTIFIVGHILVPIALAVEQIWQPPMGLQMAVWLPLALAMTVSMLPVVKGSVVGLQWALFMHGFEYAARVARPVPVNAGVSPEPSEPAT